MFPAFKSYLHLLFLMNFALVSKMLCFDVASGECHCSKSSELKWTALILQQKAELDNFAPYCGETTLKPPLLPESTQESLMQQTARSIKNAKQFLLVLTINIKFIIRVNDAQSLVNLHISHFILFTMFF